jgi:hypothetical protein
VSPIPKVGDASKSPARDIGSPYDAHPSHSHRQFAGYATLLISDTKMIEN